jgi:hypothetical protein
MMRMLWVVTPFSLGCYIGLLHRYASIVHRYSSVVTPSWLGDQAISSSSERKRAGWDQIMNRTPKFVRFSVGTKGGKGENKREKKEKKMREKKVKKLIRFRATIRCFTNVGQKETHRH